MPYVLRVIELRYRPLLEALQLVRPSPLANSAAYGHEQKRGVRAVRFDASPHGTPLAFFSVGVRRDPYGFSLDRDTATLTLAHEGLT